MTEEIKANTAIDCGAGTVNMQIGTRRRSQTVSMLSLISVVSKSSVTEGAVDIYNPSVFSLVEGDKETFYFAGEIVRDKQLQSEDVFADPMLKVTNARKLVLAALIEGLGLTKGQALKVSAVASHHDPVSFNNEIREALCGTHTIRKGNNVFTITITMPQFGVYPEGSAIGEVFGDDTPAQFGVLDLGFLTALYSLKNRDGSNIRVEKAAYGVGRLIEMLQQSPEFGKLLGGIQPERDILIASLIEACKSKATKLYYRNRGKAIDFTPVYKVIVVQWLKGAARTAVQNANERAGTDFKVVAIGGGVNLPMVAKALEKFKIVPYGDTREGAGDPIFANVETLYAKHKHSLFNLESESKSDVLRLVSPSEASTQDDLEVAENG